MLTGSAHGIAPVMSQSRSNQLRWLTQVFEKTGWSPNTLAQAAKIDPSTLYRFMSDDNHQMRRVTVARIAKVAKVEPPEFAGLSAGDAREYDLGKLPDTSLPGIDAPNLAAVKVSNDAMKLSGVAEGDILVIDRKRTARAGDIVVAQLYDFRLGTADTIIRIYEPPYLIPNTDNPEHRRPLLVDNERVQITGVAVRQIRVRELINDA